MSLWSKDRKHLVALHSGPHLNFADVRQIFLELFQDAGAPFAVRHLATAEPDGCLDLVACLQPLTRMLHAIAIIVLVRAGAEFNFLYGDDHLFLFSLVRLFLGQVLVLAIINNLANRRLGVRRDLDQIHASRARGANGVTRVHDAKLFTVFGNDAHLGHANAFVDACDRRTAKIRTSAASKTCSYCCTSSVRVSSSTFQSLKLAGGST